MWWGFWLKDAGRGMQEEVAKIEYVARNPKPYANRREPARVYANLGSLLPSHAKSAHGRGPLGYPSLNSTPI